MRYLLAIVFVLSRATMLAQPAPPSIYDWSSLESLAPGSRIMITDERGPFLNAIADRHFACTVDTITDDGIDCSSLFGGFWVDRYNIRQVHLPDNGKTILRGMAIGAAAGAGIAAIPHDGTTTDAGSRAAYGSLIGFLFGWFVAASLHHAGHLIYEQP